MFYVEFYAAAFMVAVFCCIGPGVLQKRMKYIVRYFSRSRV